MKIYKYNSIAFQYLSGVPKGVRFVNNKDLALEVLSYLTECQLEISEINFSLYLGKVHSRLHLQELKSHPDKYNEVLQNRKKWRLEHPEKIKEYAANSQWKEINKDRKKAKEREYRERKRQELTNVLTIDRLIDIHKKLLPR